MAKGSTDWRGFKKSLETGELARLYLFYGEEGYLREYYLGMLRDQLIGGEMAAFNLVQFSGKVAFDDLIEAVESYPVMSEKKLVILRDFDPFRADEAYREKLTKLFADLPETCVLVFIFTGDWKPDKRTKLYGAFERAGEVVVFEHAGRSDLIAWIKRRFRAQKRDISTELCEYLIFLCGGGMQELIPEIEKIAAYTRRSTVRREDIDAVTTPSAEAVVFDLTDAIAAKQYTRALEILERLAAMNEEPIMIHALIGRQLRQLYASVLVHRKGGTVGDLMRICALRSEYPARRMLQAARGVPLPWVRRGVRLCAETDARLKLGEKFDALELLIAQLAQEGCA